MIQKMFPQARVARLDLDTVAKKKQSGTIIDQMNQGEIDILIGTQSVTKGYHFPKVTLVGIVWADLNMHFPMYNAVETTIQQLIQVAGRAGRQSEKSRVIIQCFDKHQAFHYLNEERYREFYEYEIKNREMIGYPPAAFLVDIEMRNSDEKNLAEEASDLADLLQKALIKNSLQIDVLGPVPAVVSRIKSVSIQKIYLKSSQRMEMIHLFAAVSQRLFASSIFFTMNPVS